MAAGKPDSRDICFVPDDYATLVRKPVPKLTIRVIVHVDVVLVLGAHSKLIHYIVEGRRGIDIGGRAELLYVVRLDAEKKEVVVGPRAARQAATAQGRNWLAEVEGALRDEGAEHGQARCARACGGRPADCSTGIWRRAGAGGGAARRR